MFLNFSRTAGQWSQIHTDSSQSQFDFFFFLLMKLRITKQHKVRERDTSSESLWHVSLEKASCESVECEQEADRQYQHTEQRARMREDEIRPRIKDFMFQDVAAIYHKILWLGTLILKRLFCFHVRWWIISYPTACTTFTSFMCMEKIHFFFFMEAAKHLCLSQKTLWSSKGRLAFFFWVRCKLTLPY